MGGYCYTEGDELILQRLAVARAGEGPGHRVACLIALAPISCEACVRCCVSLCVHGARTNDMIEMSAPAEGDVWPRPARNRRRDAEEGGERVER